MTVSPASWPRSASPPSGRSSTSARSTRSLLSRHGEQALLQRLPPRLTPRGRPRATPGTLLVTRDASLILADSRYTEQAAHEAPGWELVATTRAYPGGAASAPARPTRSRRSAWRRPVGHARRLGGPGRGGAGCRAARHRRRARPAADPQVRRRGRRHRPACALTDACFAHLVDWIRPGMTEQEVAWSSSASSAPTARRASPSTSIVLAGPRAAMPHGRPSGATIDPGNVLLIDFGCIVDGYRSDMTRTLFVGDVPDDIRRCHDAVREAQAARDRRAAPSA